MSAGGQWAQFIGAEKSGRSASLMELGPQHVNVIVRRGQDYTGKSATREANVLAFDDLASAKCSTDTALHDFNELLAWGVLLKASGGGRSTAYQLNVQGRLASAPA